MLLRQKRERADFCFCKGREQSVSFSHPVIRKSGKGNLHYGLEAEYFSANEGEIAVNGLLGIWGEAEPVRVGEKVFEAAKLMEAYLKGVLIRLWEWESCKTDKG